MKHVRVRITADGHEAEIHPMYDVWANASFIKRVTTLQWNVTGDADDFEGAVEGIPEVLDRYRASW